MNIKVKTMLLTGILFFTIVPLIVILIFSMTNTSSYSHTKTDDFANAAVKTKYASMNSFFKSEIGELSGLANIDAVKNSSTNRDEAKKVIAEYISGSENPPLDFIFTDNNGSVLYSAKDIVDETSVFSAFSDEVSQDSFFISPLHTDGNYYGTSVVYLAVKVGDSGYLWQAISGEFISALISDIVIIDSGYVALADKNGNLINYNKSIVKNDDIADKNIKEKVKDLQSTSVEAPDMTIKDVGNYRLYYSVLTNASTWTVVAILPEAEVKSFSSSATIPTLVAGVACLLACLFLGWLVILSILKPMNSMIKTMKDILHAEEGADIRFNVKTKNEFKDITESFNNLLDEVSLSQERHMTVADISDSILFEWDFQKEIMFVSENFRKRFKVDIKNATLQNGKFIDSLMDADFADLYKRDMTMLIKNKNAYSNEYLAVTRGGDPAWISVRAECVTDRLGEILRVIGVITDIDNEKKMEIKLSERASYDFLSQLYNRNTFERVFVKEIERRGMNKVAILFVDLDDFKFINDRYGHSVGDEVIKYVSDVIRAKVDDRDGFAGRFGGDEYVLCVTKKEDIDNIENICQDIIDELYQGYKPSTGGLINIMCSIGIAICPEHGEEATELIKHADAAMYFVKKNGKANYHIYVETDEESSDSFF